MQQKKTSSIYGAGNLNQISRGLLWFCNDEGNSMQSLCYRGEWSAVIFKNKTMKGLDITFETYKPIKCSNLCGTLHVLAYFILLVENELEKSLQL